jgi:hypothetical protein
MIVLAIETIVHQTFKTPITIVVPESGQVIIAHLIYNNTDNQLG